MTVTIAEAFVAVRPDTKGFEQDAQQQLGTPLKNLAAGAASAFAAVRVKDLFTGFISEAREAEKVSRLTEAAIESTGGVANVTAEEMGSLAERLSEVAAVDDEVIQGAENVLLTFTKVRNEVGKGNNIFDQGTEAALNMSAALGTDLQSSIVLVGKALNDPIRGVTALQRAGVQLTESQKEQVKAFVEAGDVLSAQKIILAELETQFGGAAAAAADPAAKLSIAWGNLQEQLGQDLLPALEAMVGVLGDAIDFFSGLPGPVQQGVLAFAALAAVSGPLLTVGGNLRLIFDAATKIPSVAASAATSLARIGASAAVLGGVVAAIAAIGVVAASTGESLKDKLTRRIEELAELTDSELVARFGNAERALEGFEAIASVNVGTAIRLRDALAEQGEDVSDLNPIIDEYVTKQKNAAASADAAADAVHGEDDALADLVPTVEDATDALAELLDVTLAVFGAGLDYEVSVNRTEDAIRSYNEATKEVMETRGQDREATEAQERATLDAADAILAQAQAAADAYEQQVLLSGGTLDAADKAKIQVTELEKVAETLAPGSPLRKRLEQYIYGLAQIPRRVTTEILQVFTGRNADGSTVRAAGIGGGSGSGATVSDILGALGAAAGVTSSRADLGTAREALDDLLDLQRRLPERIRDMEARVRSLRQEGERLVSSGASQDQIDRQLDRYQQAQDQLVNLRQQARTIDQDVADAQQAVRDASVGALAAGARGSEAAALVTGNVGTSFLDLERIAREQGVSPADLNRLIDELRHLVATIEGQRPIQVTAQPGNEVFTAQSVALALRAG